MPLCKKCGLILAASDKVCRGCGTPVEQPAQSAQPPQFPTTTMPESTPLPKLSGLPYSSPLSSSAPPPTPSFGTSATSAPSGTFGTTTPAAPPPTPSFAAPPPLPPTAPSFVTNGTNQTTATPPPPPPAPSAPQQTAPQPPPPPASATTAQPPEQPPQPPAEQPQEPPRIRPKAFKPSGGSNLPPNLNIDNQPVAGVRKPQQQPLMAQPPAMEQVPPMVETSQSSDTQFSTGLGWAIVTLILCCNPIAIVSIILSAIAGSEFKRGDIESAQKHASLSKKITFALIIISLIFFFFIGNAEGDETEETDDTPQEQVEHAPVKEKMLQEALEAVNI